MEARPSRPVSISVMLGELSQHYGSTEALQGAIREIWQDNGGTRLMLKTDAICILHDRLQEQLRS